MTVLRIYAENFVHPEDRPDYLYTMSTRNLCQVLRPEQPFVTFAYRKQPERENIDPEDYGWIRATAVMTQADKNGRAKGIVYVAQDVTESKRKEMREQRAIQAACQAANQASASKSEFLSRMSHNIRTPMNEIIGMTQIAFDHMDDNGRVRDCLGKIITSSNNLLSLVNEVLDLSEIESGNVDLVAEEFRISDLMDNVVDAVLPDMKEKGLHLIWNPAQITHENVIGDQGRLRQVFLNILANSVKYTSEGGKLEISAIQRDATKYGCCSYDFIFQDDGIGMEEAFIPHIFEPFSQAEDSRIKENGGTGLGMTIAQNIVRMMGGGISVESAPGKGTCVTVTLLLKQQYPEETGAEYPAETESVSEDELFRGHRILVVEDNMINQEIAMEIIGATGAAVECASDGMEGLRRFESMTEGYLWISRCR